MEYFTRKGLKNNSHDIFSSAVHHILTKWDVPKVTHTVHCSLKVTT